MRARLVFLAFMLPACGLPVVSGTVKPVAVAETGQDESLKPPQDVSFVKMLSWGALGTDECSIDLEGTATPAHFTLGYTEKGAAPVVVDDAEDLFSRGWRIVNRSVRGYGFEKMADFTALHVDAVELLTCECGAAGGNPADVWRSKTRIHVQIDWESGGLPDVRASVSNDGEATTVKPVTIGGRLATYEFAFGTPLPASYGGSCASGFFLALLLSEPVE